MSLHSLSVLAVDKLYEEVVWNETCASLYSFMPFFTGIVFTVATGGESSYLGILTVASLLFVLVF